MGLLSNVGSYSNKLDEAIKAFKNKGGTTITPKIAKSMSGEGIEFSPQFSSFSTSSFNMFYSHYINKTFDNERAKIINYRNIAEMPEVADVIEDACIEATQEDLDGKVLVLDIQEEDLKKNKNVIDTLQEEFDNLFYNKLKIHENLYNYFRSYFIDGRFYYERIIDETDTKKGIIGIKKLPSETMDFEYDHITGKIKKFKQYLNPDSGKKTNPTDKDVIEFEPAQIGLVDYGIYGKFKSEIFGYLEKVKVPYNTLKLLETSIIIYRIVRAPERLVFKVDVGNMPRDKAMKYVEKVKQSMIKKQSYDPSTGRLAQTPDVLSIMDNFFLSTCIDLNTKIPLLNGEDKLLSEIIKDFSNGIKNEVYSIDQKTGKPIRGKINWAGITRTNTEGVRVWLDNDEYLDCTPDHKFVMRDGSEKEAQNLVEQDSLMPLYLRNKILYKKRDYKQIFNLESNKWEFVHQILGPEVTKEKNTRHHINYNRFDNTSRKRTKEERKKMSDTQKQYVIDNPDAGKLRGLKIKELYKNESYKEAHIEKIKNGMAALKADTIRYAIYCDNISKATTGENNPMFGKVGNKHWTRQISTDKLNNYSKKLSSALAIKIDEECGKYVILEILRNNFPLYKDLRIALEKNKDFMNHWITINKDIKNVRKDGLSRSTTMKIVRTLYGIENYKEFLQNITINHKVIKVEKLPYKIDTGCLTIEDPGNNHNFAICAGIFIKNSSEGRGSDISTVGGSSTAGFTELSDIKYFQRKLYQALKYPMSRVSAMQSERDSEVLFSRSPAGEISRDEIKWATFLERQQTRFCNEWLNLFLLHLEFKGLKAEYELSRDNISIKMIQPSFYKDKQEQIMREVKFNNYLTLGNLPEMSKVFLMRKYLEWDENDIKANAAGFAEDIKLGLRPDPAKEQEPGSGY